MYKKIVVWTLLRTPVVLLCALLALPAFAAADTGPRIDPVGQSEEQQFLDPSAGYDASQTPRAALAPDTEAAVATTASWAIALVVIGAGGWLVFNREDR